MALNPAPPRFSEIGRSGTRMLICMPVMLEGTDAAGKSLKENTKTVVINRSGAKVMLAAETAVGAKWKLSMGKRATLATVVWIGEKKKDQTEVGVDIEQKDNFWGVQFPEETGPLQVVASPAPPAPAPTPAPATAPAQDAIYSMIETMTREAFEKAMAPAIAQFTAKLQAAAQEIAAATIKEAEQRLAQRAALYESKLNGSADKVCQTLAVRLNPVRSRSASLPS